MQIAMTVVGKTGRSGRINSSEIPTYWAAAQSWLRACAQGAILSLLCILSLSAQADFVREGSPSAGAGVKTLSSGPNPSIGLYEEVVSDMEVKVLGGMVRVERKYEQDRWVWMPSWRNLRISSSSSLTARDFIASGTSSFRAAQLANQSFGEDQSGSSRIVRGQTVYHKSSPTSSVYRYYDNSMTITATDTGFVWQDKVGNRDEYDASGRFIRAIDRYGVSVSVVRDDRQRITGVLDHFGTQILSFAYEPSQGGRLASITDYTGREVRYTWQAINNDLRLSGVKDAGGHDWSYSYKRYDVVDSDPVKLYTKTAPSGRIITIDHREIGGGAVCVASEGGQWVQDPITLQWSYEHLRCLRYITQIPSILLSGTTDQFGGLTSYGFFYNSTNKQYTTTRQAYGTVKNTTFNANGQVVGRSRNGKQLLTLQVSDDRRRETKTDENGYVTRSEFDIFKNLTKRIYPDGSEEHWSYDRFANVTRHVDQLGVETLSTYDEYGSLIRRIEAHDTPAERISEYRYDAYGQMILMREMDDATTALAETRYTYDNYGNRTSTIDALNHSTQQTHNVQGQPLQITDAKNRIWTRSYDALGNLLTTTSPEPLNQLITYTYTPTGKVASVRNALGDTTRFSYDVRDRLVLTTDPYNKTITTTYNRQNLIASRTDESGVITRYTYDAERRLSSVVDGQNNTIRYIYGTHGAAENVMSEVRYPTYTQRSYYNQNGYLTQQTSTLKEGTVYRTVFEHDAKGRVIRSTDSADRITRYAYDALDREIRVTHPDGSTIQTRYDDRSQVLEVINELGRPIRRYEYDAYGNLTREYGQESINLRYSYDANNNLATRTDALGQVIRYDYDAANRRTTETHLPNASADDSQAVKQISYTYNAANSLTGYADSDSGALYTYDKKQRRTSEQLTVNGLQQNSTAVSSLTLNQSMGYQDNDNLVSMTYPDGTQASYRYTANNLLQSVSIDGAGTITYSNFKWLQAQTTTLPGGTTRSHTFDGLQRSLSQTVKDPAGTSVYEEGFSFDAIGNIDRRTRESALDQTAYFYGYDSRDRLTEVDTLAISDYQAQVAAEQAANQNQSDTTENTSQNNNATNTANNAQPTAFERFQYDATGNRMAVQTPPSSTRSNSSNTSSSLSQTYALDTEWQYTLDNQLQSIGGQTLASDIRGNLTTRWVGTALQQYSYDHLNRLTTVTEGPTIIATYAYDPFNRRIKKTVAGNSTVFSYSDQGMSAEVNLATTNTSTNGSNTNTSVTRANTTVYGYAPQGLWGTDPLFIKPAGEGSQVVYPITDHLGTPQMLVNQAGATVWEGQYSAFGIPLDQTNQNNRSDGSQKLRFPGQYVDSETQLYYNWNRYYDPETGRYITSDPIGLADGVNSYMYAYGNTLKNIDPDGKRVPVGPIVRYLMYVCMTPAMRGVCKEAAKCLINPAKCKRRFCKKRPNRLYHGPTKPNKGVCEAGACQKGDSEGTKQVKMNAARACVVLRKFVAVACHGGKMDKGHKREYEDAKKRIRDCQTCE